MDEILRGSSRARRPGPRCIPRQGKQVTQPRQPTGHPASACKRTGLPLPAISPSCGAGRPSGKPAIPTHQPGSEASAIYHSSISTTPGGTRPARRPGGRIAPIPTLEFPKARSAQRDGIVCLPLPLSLGQSALQDIIL